MAGRWMSFLRCSMSVPDAMCSPVPSSLLTCACPYCLNARVAILVVLVCRLEDVADAAASLREGAA